MRIQSVIAIKEIMMEFIIIGAVVTLFLVLRFLVSNHLRKTDIKKEEKHSITLPKHKSVPEKDSVSTGPEKKSTPTAKESAERPSVDNSSDSDPKKRTPSTVSRFHLESHKDGGWQVRAEDALRPMRLFTKKSEALAYAKVKVKAKATSIGRTLILVVHKRDGSIQYEFSYDGGK